jgi:FimV-like protein
MNVSSLLFTSYSQLLIIVSGFAFLLFLTGVYFILRAYHTAQTEAAIQAAMQPIAGDDVVATQLDLARAYLETGSAAMAKTILKAVAKQGSKTQREEAKQLLNHV